MEEQFRVRSAAEQVADHYLDHHEEIGPATLGELADAWGTKKAVVRSGFRIAEPVFNERGEAITVPRRSGGWNQEVTEVLTDFQVSWLDRVSAIAAEMNRAADGEAALGNPDDELVFGDLRDSFVEALTKLQALASA